MNVFIAYNEYANIDKCAIIIDVFGNFDFVCLNKRYNNNNWIVADIEDIPRLI